MVYHNHDSPEDSGEYDLLFRRKLPRVQAGGGSPVCQFKPITPTYITRKGEPMFPTSALILLMLVPALSFLAVWSLQFVSVKH